MPFSEYFVSEPVKVRAMRFDPMGEHKLAMPDEITSREGRFYLYETTIEVRVGDWILRCEDGKVRIASDEYFRKIYTNAVARREQIRKILQDLPTERYRLSQLPEAQPRYWGGGDPYVSGSDMKDASEWMERQLVDFVAKRLGITT